MNLGVIKFFLFTLIIFFSLSTSAEEVKVCDAHQADHPLTLTPYMLFYEDSSKNKTVDSIISISDQLKPIEEFKLHSYKSTYWAKIELENGSEADLTLSLYFKNLTYVELYEFKNKLLVYKHSAGIFRSKKEITVNDNSDNFTLNLNKNQRVVYYLKIDHTKGYLPRLTFHLQEFNCYNRSRNNSDNLDYLIFGAFLIFFLYSLTNYFFNRYSPYLWLAFFIIGLALYTFNLSGCFFQYFPNNPQLIWQLNNLFTTVSSIGGILLISSFFDLKERYHKGYKILNGLIVIEIIQFFLGQLVIELFNNYWWLTIGVICISFFTLSIIVFIVLKVWKSLLSAQKVFSTAIFIYTVLVIIGFLYLIVEKENSLQLISILGNLASVITILFFSIALSEHLRGIIIERNQFLVEINNIKSQQNKTLEKVVDERTKELREVNLELINGKEALLQRNNRIELLLRELHHRVKNNLQLISSFYDLRRYDPNKKNIDEISNEGQNRIKIISLVHDMLYHGDNSNTIEINAFIHQIIIHLDNSSNPNKNIVAKIECADLNFDMDTAIPLGLILNELITNAIKHFRNEKEKLEITISIASDINNSYKLIVSDNGEKINDSIIPEKAQSFGLHMIYLLCKQLNGNFMYEYNGKNNFIVKFMDSEGRKQIP
jgi:two-component sensor histidine kinase